MTMFDQDMEILWLVFHLQNQYISFFQFQMIIFFRTLTYFIWTRSIRQSIPTQI